MYDIHIYYHPCYWQLYLRELYVSKIELLAKWAVMPGECLWVFLLILTELTHAPGAWLIYTGTPWLPSTWPSSSSETRGKLRVDSFAKWLEGKNGPSCTSLANPMIEDGPVTLLVSGQYKVRGQGTQKQGNEKDLGHTVFCVQPFESCYSSR